ncbi:expressed unknown protein [Ectocarpus siliculosus]|uniref:Uncharacterized protein n=1 Tax=Ectocarpus siliculosus TaxID=2880 RepID=D7FKI5_ECTSI|nr:expressed unknown protein [Ectocarpus siliculosus]|eukprot:CBJ29387.1 expressed unknown protein [Ectocarpus siliculosus]
MAKEMASLDESILSYDGEYTHCTVATLSSFKNSRSVFCHASAADRDRIIEAWHQALTAAFARTEGLRPFDIVFRSLETSPAATFLLGDDSSKTVEALRSAVKEAARNPKLSELSAELENKYEGAHPDLFSLGDGVHIPNIIHSTVMRVASEVSDEGRLGEGLADLGARWEPTTVRVGKISLVYEKHPYMHLSREGAEARSYRLPFN